MTLKEARQKLAGPLVFGDAEQCQAIKTISEIEAVVDRIKAEKANVRKCDECEGEGEHSCSCGDSHDCNKCDGTGLNECPSWFREVDQDTREEVLELLGLN